MRCASATRARRSWPCPRGKGKGSSLGSTRLASAEAGTAAPPELDYDEYAEGEARLGWLNATLQLDADAPFDGNRWLRHLAGTLQQDLAAAGVEVAHLKAVLTPREEGPDLAVLNLVRGDGAAEMSHTLAEPLEAGELLLNLRAEGDPERLESAVRKALGAGEPAVRVGVDHLERFRPARPVPVHRMAEA